MFTKKQKKCPSEELKQKLKTVKSAREDTAQKLLEMLLNGSAVKVKTQ